MLELWDTSGADVVRKLAAVRRSVGGGAGGLALTLIAVTDETRVRAVEEAATVAAAEHPCRLLVVVRDAVDAPSRLDAEIIVGGRLGPCEAVILRMRGRLALHAESVVMPLLAPDVPVVTWWHGTPPDRIAYDPLGVVADRRITDAAECADPAEALRQRAVDYAPGDTDLAWTRATPWRSLIAGAFDTVDVPTVSAVLSAAPTDPTAILIGGWLTARLGLTATIEADGARTAGVAGAPCGADCVAAVTLRLADDAVVGLAREDGTAVLHRTGVADRVLPLVRRRLGDELAEELRRLDPDQPYAAALSAATGVTGLATRPLGRSHIWHDPTLAEHPGATA